MKSRFIAFFCCIALLAIDASASTLFLDPNGEPSAVWTTGSGTPAANWNKGTRQPTAPSLLTQATGTGSLQEITFADDSGNVVGTATQVIVWVYGNFGGPPGTHYASAISVDNGGSYGTVTNMSDTSGGSGTASNQWMSLTVSGSWSHSQINALQAEIKLNGGGGGTVYAMYTEITYSAGASFTPLNASMIISASAVWESRDVWYMRRRAAA